MNIKGQTKLLTSNLRIKWLRTLIASGGILIGVLCITLTTAFTTGILFTITKSVNSIYQAKSINISPTRSNKDNIFDLNRDDIIAKSYEDIQKIKELDTNIESVYPTFLNINYTVGINEANCKLKEIEINKITDKVVQSQDQSNYQKFCIDTRASYQPFEVLFENNKKNWLGPTNNPGDNETVIVYDKSNIELLKKINIESAKDLIDFKFKLEFNSVSGYTEIGKAGFLTSTLERPKLYSKEFTVVAVIDNSKVETPVFRESNGSGLDFWLPYSDYINVIKEGKSDIPAEKIGYTNITAITQSIEKIDTTLTNLKGKNLVATSPVKEFLNLLNIVMSVITAFLSAFGLLALIVSIFGIINVIAMSVLEKQKEIGILKSLGASNYDIFGLFIGESITIGILGWLLGSIFAFIILTLGNLIINRVILPKNPNISTIFKSLDIQEILILPPNWLYGLTLIVAIFFTTLSAIIPSINAARKRPVDTLRTE